MKRGVEDILSLDGSVCLPVCRISHQKNIHLLMNLANNVQGKFLEIRLPSVQANMATFGLMDDTEFAEFRKRIGR